MIPFIVRRLIGAIPTLIIASLLIYAILLAAPGGPTARFDNNPKISQTQRDAFAKRWGLDQPVPIQYCRWLGACNPNGSGLGIFISDHGLPNILPAFLGGGDNGIVHGDLGYSIVTGESVSDVIANRAPRTFVLAFTALVLWIALAFVTGVIAAVRRYSKTDNAITIFNYVGFSFPTFWLGIMLIVIFSATLHWFPAGGMWNARVVPIFNTPEYWAFVGKQPLTALTDLGSHLFLPVITLIVVSVAGDSRFIRAAMIDAMNQDYVRTARAKGLPEKWVIRKHALRNALLPVTTNIGLEIPFLFAGAIATETIFSWPGMGNEFIRATANFDYPVLMGILVITAVLVVGANLIADIVYGIVDPRISYG